MNTSLYLYPLPVLELPPPLEQVRDILQRCGFLGDELAPGRFQAGADFLAHVTFAGCSPCLELEPPPSGGWNFCHIRLQESERVGLVTAPQRGRPRCPRCRAAVPAWKEMLPRWARDASLAWRCSECGGEMAAAELDWRQYGVAARQLVEICQVWPGEAVPGDGLLRALAEGTAREWRHAWAASQAAASAALGSSSSMLTGK